MDNASGNLSNVPSRERRIQVNRGPHTHLEPAPGPSVQGLGQVLQNQSYEQLTALTRQHQESDEDLMLPGLAETLMEEPPPSRPIRGHSPQATTLDNDARLYSPTPVDVDPPPLMDVPPLSRPVREPLPLRPPQAAGTDSQPWPLPRARTSPDPAASAEIPVRSPFRQPSESPVPHYVEPLPMPEPESILDVQTDPILYGPVPLPTGYAEDYHLDYDESPELVHHFVDVPDLEPLLETDPLVGGESEWHENSDEPLLEIPTEEPAIHGRVEKDLALMPTLLLNATESAPEFVAPEMESLDLEAPEMESLDLVAPEMESLDLESPEIEAPELAPSEAGSEPFGEEAAQLPAPRLENSASQRVKVKTESYVRNEFFVSEGAEDPWILPASAAAKSANHRKRQARSRPGIWNTLTSLFFCGGMILGILILGAWLMRERIARNIEANVAQQVEEAGLFVDYESWNYDPVRGIVLDNVTVYEGADKVIPYARVNNFGFNTNLFALFKTKDIHAAPSVVSFKNSDLSLFDRGEGVAEFKNLRGSIELALKDGKISLDHLKGQLHGLRFEVEGEVALPLDSESAGSAFSFRDPLGILSGVPSADPVVINDQSSGLAIQAPEIPKVISVSEAEAIAPDGPPLSVNTPASELSSAVPSEIDIPSPSSTSSETATTDSDSLPTEIGGKTAGIKLPSLAILRDFVPYSKLKSEGEPPLLTSELSIDLTDPEAQKVTAVGRLTADRITMEDSPLKGASFHSVNIPYRFDRAAHQVNLSGFTLGYGTEGVMAGTASYHLKTHQLSLSNLRSNVDIVAMLIDFDPDMKEFFKNITFLDRPEIVIASGQIPLDAPLSGNIDFQYEQWGGLLINTDGKILSIREIRGNFKLGSSSLSAPDLKAVILDGPATIAGTMRLDDSTYPFNGSVKVRGMPLESIAKYSGIDAEQLKGSLNLDYQGSVSKNVSSMGGSGVVEIQNGQLYQVPVLGPVQRLLGAAVPAFGTRAQSGAFGRFIIESGVFTASDLTLRSDGTRITVRGQADLARQLTAFSARANLDGPLGIATGLASETIELEGLGPLTKPQIKLKSGGLPAAFTTDKAKQALGIADGSTEAMSAVIQDIAGQGSGVGNLFRGISGSAPANGSGNASSILNGIMRGDR